MKKMFYVYLYDPCDMVSLNPNVPESVSLSYLKTYQTGDFKEALAVAKKRAMNSRLTMVIGISVKGRPGVVNSIQPSILVSYNRKKFRLTQYTKYKAILHEVDNFVNLPDQGCTYDLYLDRITGKLYRYTKTRRYVEIKSTGTDVTSV